jgi:hypothetical protein
MEKTGSQLLETIFLGDSEMSRLMRATDWTQTRWAIRRPGLKASKFRSACC